MTENAKKLVSIITDNDLKSEVKDFIAEAVSAYAEGIAKGYRMAKAEQEAV